MENVISSQRFSRFITAALAVFTLLLTPFAPVADALTVPSYPQITGLSLSKYADFDPVKEDLMISFNLLGDANVLVDISYQGSLVKTLNAGFKVKGDGYSIIWDGNTNSGTTQPGQYAINVKSHNQTTQQKDSVWTYVTVIGSSVSAPNGGTTCFLPAINGLNVNPSTLAVGNMVKIEFYLAEKADKLLSVQILQNGGFVANLQYGTGEKGPNGPYYWTPLAAGTYTVKIRAEATGCTTAAELSSAIIVTSGTTGGGTGASDNSGNANVNNNPIQNNNSNVVNVYGSGGYGSYGYGYGYGTGYIPAQPNPNCTWDYGTNQWYCPQGGSSTVQGTGVPYIFSDVASPNPYNPQTQGNLVVSYFISTSANVTVEIYQGNNFIRTLKPSTNELYSQSAQWNGQYSSGGYALPGTYEYRITASNSYGTTTQKGPITVVGTTGGVYYGGGVNPQPVACAGFSDVNLTSSYCKAIQELFKLGIFEGYADGTFRPYQKITRAETMKVMLKALDYPLLAGSGNVGFWDVNPGAWYIPFLTTGRAYNIISGYPDGSFKPNNTINKVELLKVVLRTANIQPGNCPFQPYADTPRKGDTSWYMPYACYAAKYFLVDPDGSGRMHPAEKMTRGDVANLIYRAHVQGLFTYKPTPITNQNQFPYNTANPYQYQYNQNSYQPTYPVQQPAYQYQYQNYAPGYDYDYMYEY